MILEPVITGTPILHLHSDYENGWVGYGPGWRTAHHDVPLAGQPNVKFRLKFAADGTVNFLMALPLIISTQDPYPNDLGVIDLISPVSGADLTASKQLMNVRNYGTLAQSGFPVSFCADGGVVHTETFTGTIAPGTSSSYIPSAATADLSAVGMHEICS